MSITIPLCSELTSLPLAKKKCECGDSGNLRRSNEGKDVDERRKGEMNKAFLCTFPCSELLLLTSSVSSKVEIWVGGV